MKGKRWKTLIQQEKAHYHELSSQPHVSRMAHQMKDELDKVRPYVERLGYTIGGGAVEILLTGGSRFSWRWVGKTKKTSAEDVDVQGDMIWYVTSEENTHYKNQLLCEDHHGDLIWKKPAVSSQIAVIEDRCYYIRVTDLFVTAELCMCDARTGKKEKILYRERDKERDIVLSKGAHRTLYMLSSDPMRSTLYRVDGESLVPLYQNSVLQMPLGRSIQGEDCALIRRSHQEGWIPMGAPLASWTLPTEEIQWVNLQTGHVLTIWEGSQTIWHCHPHKKPSILYRIAVGAIDVNIWADWENTFIQSFTIHSPYSTPFVLHVAHHNVFRKHETPITHPMTFAPLEVHRYHVASADGTRVPFVCIRQKGVTPKAQFIYVYGSYGSTTPVNWPYQQWYPLLQRKWVIVFAMVRGGGDVDAAWADAARREHRHVTIDDFEAVIRGSQKRHGLGPAQTVIYGRSAGGVPVGAIVSRYPHGQLVGAAFTEVPYVDVLRTSSNPDLPLTVGEYKEFGNPRENILNGKELLSVSPINTLHSEGAPGVFVMSHVGLLDRQVFAYESFKWIQRLRGTASWEERDSDPKGKYVTFEKKEAHQYRPQSSSRFRAMDLAILDAWAEGRLRWSGGGLFDPAAYKIMLGSNIKMSANNMSANLSKLNSSGIPPPPAPPISQPAVGGSRRNRSRRNRSEGGSRKVKSRRNRSEGGSRKVKSRRNRSEGGKRKARKAKKSKKSKSRRSRGGERKSRKDRKNKKHGGSRKNKSRRSRRNE